MRFTPKSEAELAENALLPEGEYTFEILTAEDTQSKSTGNDMLKLSLRIFENGGENSQRVFDYLVSIDSMIWKIRHFADAIGMLPEYDSGEMLAETLPGRTGKCKIVIQPASGQWDAKNAVKDYLPRPAGMADDIPF